jgi:hypothetical protein
METFAMPHQKMPKSGIVPIDQAEQMLPLSLLVTLDSTHNWFPPFSPGLPPEFGAQFFVRGAYVYGVSDIELAPHDQNSPPTYHRPMVQVGVRTLPQQFFRLRFYVESAPQDQAEQTATWNYVVTLPGGGPVLPFPFPGGGIKSFEVTLPNKQADKTWLIPVLSLEPTDKWWFFRKCEIYGLP